MNTTIVYTLDCRKSSQKADGTYPILMRIIRGKVTSQLAIKLSVHEKDWDEKKRIIKSSYKGTESVARLNNYLQKKKSEAMDILTKLDEKKQLDALSPAQIKELIQKKPDRLSFFKYTEKIIEEMKNEGRIGNARIYKSVLGVIRGYCKGKDLTFQDMNYAFLKKFESTHLSKGNSYNSLGVYFRTIRAIYNKAIKDGIVDKELYPFENITIKTVKTRKRAISVHAIQKIEALGLDPGTGIYDARNYFLFSFYTRGMPFADMAELTLSSIIEGRIFYQRKKTDKPYNIKINEPIQKILDIYCKGKSQDEYIFDIIKRDSLTDQYKDIEWARNRYNKRLQKIAELCGIEENLTSYVSRHSFATRAKNLGVPIATISDMLGHESTKTTEIYLDSLPSDIMDDYHEQIINTSKE
ncbi:MAG: site-specific integrase [Chitinophagales bacterium]|nr:site-specific integrase [Chitinophagales bacterium]